jgi:hypothetical protein
VGVAFLEGVLTDLAGVPFVPAPEVAGVPLVIAVPVVPVVVPVAPEAVPLAPVAVGLLVRVPRLPSQRVQVVRRVGLVGVVR